MSMDRAKQTKQGHRKARMLKSFTTQNAYATHMHGDLSICMERALEQPIIDDLGLWHVTFLDLKLLMQLRHETYIVAHFLVC